MSHWVLHRSIWFLLISLLYLSCGGANGEAQPPSLQHPKHQPQEQAEDTESDSEDSDDENVAKNLPQEGLSAPALEEKDDKQVKEVDNPPNEELKTSDSKKVDPSANLEPKKADDPVVKQEPEELKPEDDTDSQVKDKAETIKESKSIIDEPKEVEDEDATEDAPLASFKEFREQMEKEKETKKDEQRKAESVDADSGVEKPKTKLIQKNYADNSCGSKIVDNKKEFKNCGTILNNNKDLYAMIPCEGPIWFVIELCDTIQVNAIQLANYELFSSSIKEFKVYTAETYPPKEWKHLGTFETENNRQIQKFDIENHGEYTKYVRFEKITSRGKEHFCVLSTFEVLGMSMVDEYEEVQHQKDQEVDSYEQPLDQTDDLLDSEPSDKSLIQGAKDTVKNIVDSALNVLGVSKTEEAVKNDTQSTKDVDTPTPPEEATVEPTEESVIIKVDEMGKEIKNDVVPDKRLKGEEDLNVDVVETPTPASPVSPSTVRKDPPNVAEREAIMEGVDLSKDDDDTYIPSADSKAPVEKTDIKKPEVTKTEPEVKPDSQPSQHETKGESIEVKPQEKVEKAPEAPEPKPDTGSPDKGVIMTNSPKKNSIFVELDKKIKELEKNLSLSNDYLETLSSRYKRVDQSFKPLQKTLTTIDEVMVHFETRLKTIESKFDTLEGKLDIFLQHLEDSKTKSSTLINTTNLILCLLLLMFYFLWRMSYKVNQISYCVFDAPRENKATYVDSSSSNKNDSNPTSRKRQRTKLPKDSSGIRSRETSPKPGLLSFKSETNLPKKISHSVESKKPLESVQMDLIYPQQKSPTMRRKAKNVR